MPKPILKALRSPFFILLLIFLFHLCINIIVINQDKEPLVYDAYENYFNAKNYFYDFRLNSYRPPLISFLCFPLFSRFGVSQKVASFGIGAFSLFVLLLTTYLLAKDLYSKGVGLLSVFILSSFPVIFGHSRTCMSDLLLSGWVTFTVLLLIQARAFISLKYTIPLGIVLGLGMLTRFNYLFYIAAPLTYVLIKNPSPPRKKYFNLLLAFLIAFSICAFWYLPYAYRTASEYVKIGQFRTSIDIVKAFIYYFDSLRQDAIGIVCLVIFFIFLSTKRKIKNQSAFSLLLIWILIPYCILSFFDFKNARFIMPLLPALVIIDGFFVANMQKGVYKKIMLIFIFLAGISQTLFISFSSLARPIEPDTDWGYREWNYQVFGLLQPRGEDWKVAQIYSAIKEIHPDIPKKVVFIKTRPIIVDGLKDVAKEGNFEISLSNFELCCMNLKRDKFRNNGELLRSELKKADIVVRIENSGLKFCDNEDRFESLFRKNIGNFSLTNSIALPDGSCAQIYQNDSQKN